MPNFLNFGYLQPLNRILTPYVGKVQIPVFQCIVNEQQMNVDIALRTISPFLILIGLGFISRRTGLLREGDEQVLNSFIYYFALPAFLVSNLSEIDLAQLNLGFFIAGLMPILITFAIFSILYFLFRFSKGTFSLLIICTVFGNLLFYGIPFIVFAFPEAGSLATLSAAFISILAIPISITLLELYNTRGPGKLENSKRVLEGLAKNPVIVSVLLGVLLSVLKIGLPAPILSPLNLLGATTIPVGIFLLGVFFYGRRYSDLAKGFKLSLLRMVFSPAIAFVIAGLVNLSSLETTTVVIMHGTPLAIPMIVFSERYNFYKDTIASLLLISSVLGGMYLNVWLLILGR